MSECPIVPVVICGGAGSRLWPASRESYPKQMLAIAGGTRSLLQQTLERVTGPMFAPPIIVTGNDYRFLVADQLLELRSEGQVVLEPMRRDSCAAIAAGALLAVQRDPEALVLVLAADHAIADADAFLRHVQAGVSAAMAGRIVTFGIKPSHPATGYGYIRPGAAIGGHEPAHDIGAFVEKPDAATAADYVRQGYVWNSGNFLFKAGVFLAELRRLAPDIHDPVAEAVAQARQDLDFLRLAEEPFGRARATSVDYAVMEKTALSAVILSDFPWSDIGSWAAVWELSAKDAQGNAAQGDAVFHDARNNYVHSPHMLTSVVGVDDVVVVTTRDAVLVARKDQAEEVKALVAALTREGRPEATEHVRSYRPWGSYEQVDKGRRYQVKRISVKPGGKLSLQSHVHRAEHWVVVSGTAQVTLENEVHLLSENQSIYVPLGAKHRLENPGRIPLDLIEVQSGAYLGEDDIVRYEDVYNRD